MAVKEKDTEAVAVSEEKNKALKLAIEKIEKDFGKGSIMKLGDKTAVACEAIPTGALALDLALGIGGVPRGRVIEVYGPEASGKTTFTPRALAYSGSSACSASTNAAMPPFFWHSATICWASVVLPEASGP